MISHSVIFILSHAKGSIKADLFIAASKLFNIPGVKNFEILKQTNQNNKYEYGIIMQFENTKIYGEYSNHPDHQLFIQEHWVNGVADFLEIDFNPL